jgi:hypothetical protein
MLQAKESQRNGKVGGFTSTLLHKGQHKLVLLPLVAHELRCLLTAPVTLLAEDRAFIRCLTNTPAVHFCRPVRIDRSILQSRFWDKRQISRGKLYRIPYTTAGFSTSALNGYGLRNDVFPRPASHASDPVLVHRLVRLLHASFRPRLAATPLALRYCFTSIRL